MEKLVLNKLNDIQVEYEVKILLAIESGSRAWGIHSKDSDYDVRFIYVHSPNWYLSIDPQGIGDKRDVIELPINEKLDINGWEITKALRLFRKSNPSLFEWLRSDVMYCRNYSFLNQLILLESDVFNPRACVHHYFHIAKNNFKKLQQNPELNIKFYFYILRSIFCCKWIEHFKSIPPIDFLQLVQAMNLTKEIKKEIHLLLNQKRRNVRSKSHFPIIMDYIEEELSHIQGMMNTFPSNGLDPIEKLNRLFRDTLMEVWRN